MASFMLHEIRNNLRLKGYKVDKYTNRRVINTLLELKKDSTMRDICKKLEMNYMGREGDFMYNDSKEIFLHFLETKTRVKCTSITDANKSIGINIFTESKKIENVLDRLIFLNGERAVLSLEENLDSQQNFSRCTSNKININLALSFKLGYVVDSDISLPEIFDLLQEEIPREKLKERLCQLLEIPYFFTKFSFTGGKRKKISAKTQNETLIFSSTREAARFFQTDHNTILDVIKKNYRFPLWFKRYTLEILD